VNLTRFDVYPRYGEMLNSNLPRIRLASGLWFSWRLDLFEDGAPAYEGIFDDWAIWEARISGRP
jgi:hypothetical protein